MSEASLFPLFLKLSGRRCLVIGNTPECEDKIIGLLRSGASVSVIAPSLPARIQDLHLRGEITWHKPSFRSEDLDSVTLVVAADEDQSVNEQVYREASERGVLCNIVDQPQLCHFYYPAVVRRGQLQIAISTNGLSPALASSIRADLDQRFGALYAEWVERLGRARMRVLRRRPKSPERTALLQKMASRARFERFERRRTQNGGAQ